MFIFVLLTDDKVLKKGFETSPIRKKIIVELFWFLLNPTDNLGSLD